MSRATSSYSCPASMNTMSNLRPSAASLPAASLESACTTSRLGKPSVFFLNSARTSTPWLYWALVPSQGCSDPFQVSTQVTVPLQPDSRAWLDLPFQEPSSRTLPMPLAVWYSHSSSPGVIHPSMPAPGEWYSYPATTSGGGLGQYSSLATASVV